MKPVVASAPGKLVLCGEYAVLEGAPAIVLALDRRAQVTLTPRGGDGWLVDAPTLGIHGANGRLDGCGEMRWSGIDAATVTRLSLVGAVLADAARDGDLPACHANLDTAALFVGDGQATKLGLGSSAALTVALAGGLATLMQRPLPQAERLIAAHRRMQSGRGSGLDIAASLHGGSMIYRLADDRPQITGVDWPASLHFACAWSGKSASTAVFLRDLAAWRQHNGADYAVLMRELGACASVAAQAMATGAVADLLPALAAYGAILGRLGTASALDIVCAEHLALARLAHDCGVVYKTCGAGGGDLGIGISDDPQRIAAFRQRVARAGLHTLNLQIDPFGLRVN